MDILEEDVVDEEDFVQEGADRVSDLGPLISLGGGPRSLRRAIVRR